MKFKSTLLLASLFISPFALGQHLIEKPTTTIDPKNIDVAKTWLPVRAKELLDQTGVPGMAIAVVHNGQIIYKEGFGFRNIDTKTKVDPATVFQIASISKSLASTVVAGAVGRPVSWDDRIQKYDPNFALKDPAITARVTIADMFSHRSGLPGLVGNDLEDFKCNRSEIIHQLRLFPLQAYKTTYDYSNFGITAGAEAVAKARKTTWEDLSDKVLFEPVGMTMSSFRWSDYHKRADKADLHVESAPGKWVVSARQPDAQAPAGGASSNVIDMAKWMILQLNDGKDADGRIIINKVALLRTREQLMLMPVPTAKYYYGLGMVTSQDETGRLHYRHSGAFTAGASTTFDIMPSEKLGIVVLTNGFPKGIPEAIAQEFFDVVEFGKVKSDRFPELAKMFKALEGQSDLVGTKPEKPAPAPNPDALAGSYANDYFGVIKIVKDGNEFKLLMNPCGSTTFYPMQHWDGNMYSFHGDPLVPVLSGIEFIPAKGSTPSKLHIKAFDVNGYGTFVRSY